MNLKRMAYGISYGLSVMLFYRYVWEMLRPKIFNDGYYEEHATSILAVMLLLYVLLVVICIIYERKVILQPRKATWGAIALHKVLVVAIYVVTPMALYIYLDL